VYPNIQNYTELNICEEKRSTVRLQKQKWMTDRPILEITQLHKKAYTLHTIYSNNNTQHGNVHFHARVKTDNIRLETSNKNKKAFSLPHIPVETSQDNHTETEDVNHLTKNVRRILWHQSLCHIHNYHQAHKYADDIPLMSTPNEVEKCNTCLTCKMRKSNRSKGNIREDATEIEQSISIIFGCIVQKSKNKEGMKTLTSLNGSIAHMMAMDHHSHTMWAIYTSNKRPSLARLNKVLTKFKQKGERYAMMDL
jgi:hypothetical protein